MSESNENLAELARFVRDIARQENDERCPVVYGDTPRMLLDDHGVPIVLDGKAVDFAHLVGLSTVVHPATLGVSTLGAIVDFFAGSEIDSLGSFIRIVSPSSVEVQRNAFQDDGVRDTVLRAAYDRAPVSLFGQWLPVDDFATWLLSDFDEGGDAAALYTAVEDGVTYEATLAAGDGSRSQSESVKVKWADDIGPRFKLRFLCTFPEVDQPERLCVFRARRAGGEIEVKLVDADGGAWARTAIASISMWLKGHEELQGVTILG